MIERVRTLAQIDADLVDALKAKLNNRLFIGELLCEARAKLGDESHGKWLPWLKKHGVNERSARRYMALFEFSKSVPGSDLIRLNLTTKALYAIAEAQPSADAVAAIRTAAAMQRLDEDDVRAMLIPADDADQADGRDDEPEAPPPGPALLPRDQALLDQFNDAVNALNSLRTKQSRKFFGTPRSNGELDLLGNFLKQIAAERAKSSSADESAEAA
jgi:hypothetical protein